MSKTLYYRETNSKTGKQIWVKIDGIKGNKDMIFIDRSKFESDGSAGSKIFFVYKHTKAKIYFEYPEFTEEEKLKLMTRK